MEIRKWWELPRNAMDSLRLSGAKEGASLRVKLSQDDVVAAFGCDWIMYACGFGMHPPPGPAAAAEPLPPMMVVLAYGTVLPPSGRRHAPTSPAGRSPCCNDSTAQTYNHWTTVHHILIIYPVQCIQLHNLTPRILVCIWNHPFTKRIVRWPLSCSDQLI